MAPREPWGDLGDHPTSLCRGVLQLPVHKFGVLGYPYSSTPTLLLSLLLLPLPPLSYYFATKHFAADTKFPSVVELTTQLLILENILWLPLCQINKFGLNTLPSKTVAIPYTCGLSRPFSGTVAGEHSSTL